MLTVVAILCLSSLEGEPFRFLSHELGRSADHFHNAVFAFSQALRQLQQNPADVYIAYFTDMSFQ